MHMRQLASDRVTRVHTPAFLQNVSLGFEMPDINLIADRVSPRVPVNKQSNKYRVWGRNMLQVHESRWAPGTIPNAIEMRWSEDTYFAELRKLRTLLLDTERRNSDSDIQLETMATELVTGALKISREKRVADLFTTAANYSAGNKITKAGGSEWDQSAVASTDQPLQDLFQLIRAVVLAAMVPASSLSVIIPEPVYLTAIWKNAAILDRIKYSERGIVTYDLLAALLGVKEVIPAPAMFTGGNAPETADSDVITAYQPAYLWGDTVWVGLINGSRTDRVPTFSRSFNWREESGGQDRQIRQYRCEDEGREADWTEAKEAIGEKIVFADAGGIIVNTLSTI
jgi:hypothetical protein